MVAMAQPDSVLMILPVGEMLRRAARRAYRLDFWLRKGIRGRPVEAERFLCDEATAAIRARAQEVTSWCLEHGHNRPLALAAGFVPLTVAQILFPEEEIVG